MTSATEVTWEQALAWRLRRHHLVERAAPSELLRVVSAICGLHAQLMSSAGLSVWARVEGFEREALQDELWQRRSLVKLWAMRGTLHLLPASELGVWLAGLGTYTDRGMTGHPAIDRLSDAVGRALDGRILTREELALAVEEFTGENELAGHVASSWGSYLKPSSFRGRLCFATSDDGRVRFTTPATWLREPLDRPDPEEALREVTRRFLAAYAPATAADLALWWNGSGPARGRRMLAELGDEAVELEIDGGRFWALAGDARELSAGQPARSARLLPAFDPWVAGASRTEPALLAARHRARVYRPQGWFSPVLLVDGRMVGVWRHERTSRRVLVGLEPFGRLRAGARAELEAEAERLAAFLGRGLTIGR
ncbi:MAG TPA: winged helix DNA-binding domain-containing protein [Gaiellaceae bacterium]